MIRVALIGNPNVGKTELFNRLTGLRQHVGNWPGVTVEKKVGKCMYKGVELEIVDLPGTYSLTAHSIDELIARDYIVEEKPDVVIDIVDGTNLERNLYLTLLLLELEANVVLALNQWDMVNERGIEIDVDKLSELLGIPVVPTVATTGEGVEALKEAVLNAARENERGKRKIVMGYGEDVEAAIKRVEEVIAKDANLSEKYPSRWLAIKALEHDDAVLKRMADRPYWHEIKELLPQQ
ncbi:MAG: 50S ribosome-binding GTPase [Methanophagales archaeon]|nr:50S ribosome-binding GTPase [Methanophagales archaeon]MCW3139415.1 50S ribosome-binding GTPase [Methanophagales archaeon]MCW7069844.1 50S ribosome-binding GTPase [Methanophagales archaeon]MCW7072677.1 50S ribosome-binding GTPase [Methanophagales archaeon]